MRTLSLVTVDTEAGVPARTWRFLDGLRSLGPVDVVLAGSHDPAVVAELEARAGGVVVDLGPFVRSPLRPWWFVGERHVPPEVAELADRKSIRADVRRFMQTRVPRHDAVWCETPLWMHLAGKARRDLPVFVDVPGGHEGRHAQRWMKCDRMWTAAADLVTVDSPARREELGVPGALVIIDSGDLDRFRASVGEIVALAARWPSGVGR